MSQWEIQTRKAREAFKNKSYLLSVRLGRECLALAFEQFDDVFADQPDRAVAAVIVSYSNLIDNLEAVQDLQGACNQFEHAFDFIKDHSAIASDEVESAAVLNGALQLRKEWLIFVNKHRFELNNAMSEPVDSMTNAVSRVPEHFH